MKVINANIQTQSTSYINLQSVFVCHTNKVSPRYSQQKTKSYQKKHSLAKAVTSLDSKDFEDIYQRTYG